MQLIPSLFQARTLSLFFSILLVFWGLALFFYASPIEEKLLNSSSQMLSKIHGTKDLNLRFNGRDAYLSGSTPSRESLDKIISALHSHPGIRTVEADINTLPPITATNNFTQKAHLPLQAIPAKNKQANKAFAIHFSENGNEWQPYEKLLLNQIALLLEKKPNLRLQLSGFSDNAGSHTENVKTSLRRAKIIFNYLTNKGIPKQKIRLQAFGGANPIGDNKTAAGRALNRRVEAMFF